MKIISMYLPQFYETEENNRWWGKGYTDWDAVKLGKPLFDGHNQPRVPYHHIYYDLLQKDVMVSQAELMKRYGIYGQCFYHYWFENGKKLLYRPAENLLKWSDIDMPFCFSWANETWVRSWSNIVEANVWAPKFEVNDSKRDDNGILVKQEYGSEKQWTEHFYYLLPFFKDSRYIKKDQKPVFMFFRPDHIPCLDDMIMCWKKLAKQAGLNGIYFIGANTENRRGMDALYVHATGSMLPSSCYQLINSVRCISYKTVWQQILFQACTSSEDVYVGGLVDFDTTARKGKSGTVILDCNAYTYKESLKKLLAYNERNGIEFTFLNAWNEWGEGMYLEPDEKNQFIFLEATRDAVFSYQEADLSHEDFRENIAFLKRKADQYKSYWRLMDSWMQKKERHEKLGDVIWENGYRHVAVYGAGILGGHLIRELEESDIIIDYLIDARKRGSMCGVHIFQPENQLPETDLIVVSVIGEFDSIKRKLRKITDTDIISLEDLIFKRILI